MHRVNDGDAQSPSILVHQFQPVGVPVQRENLSTVVHESGEMCGLTARGGTRIEHQFAWLRVEQWWNQLRGFIFNIDIRSAGWMVQELGNGAFF